MENIKNGIVNWIRDYTIKNGLKTLVVGVSGGIDSAVVSTLCAHTGIPVILLEMPIHQSESEVSRSEKHINFLKENFDNISSYKVDLTNSFESIVGDISKNLPQSEGASLAMVNTRSRLRMLTLHAYSNTFSGIVVGTGNKVEDFGIGFFTKYGDGGVDISPIGDLMKSEVYQLGRHLGVIEEILNARPTDGLWTDGRTDEDQIGATYDELEWAMKLQESVGDNPVGLSGRESEVFQIYIKRHLQNKHKMEPIPTFYKSLLS
jgi:NAD+ synthase